MQALGERDNRYLAAWVQPDGPTAAPTKLQLTAALQAKLPTYMVPNVLVLVERFPVTANGKLDRKALHVPAQTEAASEAPSSEHEAALLGLFRDLLRPDIGPTDNFFEAGGSSLRAMQLSVAIRCGTP